MTDDAARGEVIKKRYAEQRAREAIVGHASPANPAGLEGHVPMLGQPDCSCGHPANPAGLREVADDIATELAVSDGHVDAADMSVRLRRALVATEPGLDVERLARALSSFATSDDPEFDDSYGPIVAIALPTGHPDELAQRIAAEYARLREDVP